MKKILSIFLCVLMMLSVIPVTSIGDINVAAAGGGEKVVYLRDLKTGENKDACDGTLEHPYNDMHKAIDHIAATSGDGTIVVCGPFTQSGPVKPASSAKNVINNNYTDKITITSKYGGVDYRTTDNAVYNNANKYFVLNCEVEFNEITFYITKATIVVAQGYPFTIGDGVTMNGNSEFTGSDLTHSFVIVGGYLDQNGGGLVDKGYSGVDTGVDAKNDCNVTVKSGKNIIIIAYNYNSSSSTAPKKLGNNSSPSNVTICGTANVSKVYCGSVHDTNKPLFGAITLTIDGNVIINKVCGPFRTATVDSLTINWMSGKVNQNISLLKEAGDADLCKFNHLSVNYSDKVALTSLVPKNLLVGVAGVPDNFPDVKESIIPTLLSAGLTLDGKIGVNFKLAKVDGLGDGQTIKTKISDEDEINHDLIESEGSYVFSHYVAAKQMADEITVTYSAPNASNASKKSIEYTYSVKEYADTIIANEGGAFSPKLVALAEAMLTYGAYTQLYADYNTENLATATPNVVSGVTVDAANKATKASNANIGFVAGANLVLLDDTTFKVYVKLNGGVDKNTLTFTVGTTPVEAVEEDGYYVIYINGIDAGKLSNKYDIKVSNGVDTISFSANALSYCHAALASGKAEHTEALKNVVRALVAYDKAASDYAN